MRPNLLTMAIALAPNSLNIENEEKFRSERWRSRAGGRQSTVSLLIAHGGSDNRGLHQWARPDLLQIAADYALPLGDPTQYRHETAGAGLGRRIRSGRGDRLDTPLLIVRDDRHRAACYFFD